MAIHKYGYLILTNNLIDDTDPTKQLKINLSNISSDTTVILTVPDVSTEIIGNDTNDILTNKIIQGPSNTIDANNLKTTTNSVNISEAESPSIGQVLTAISETSAKWQNPQIPSLWMNMEGIVSTPNMSLLKEYYGSKTTLTASVIFDITETGNSGNSIFSNLSNCYMYATCSKNTTAINSIPYASIIPPVDNKKVIVNVNTGNTGNILIGGSYNGMTSNTTLCTVYLYIMGV